MTDWDYDDPDDYDDPRDADCEHDDQYVDIDILTGEACCRKCRRSWAASEAEIAVESKFQAEYFEREAHEHAGREAEQARGER
jgi:hypothetical protein